MTENKKLLVAGIGELLWDMLPSGKRAGGAPVNFVYNTARLGAEGYAVSAVGGTGLAPKFWKSCAATVLIIALRKWLIRPGRFR